MNAGNWWGMTSDEDKEAYLKWCEERKLQMKEVEEYGESMNKYTEMKVKYMFSLTRDYLKFCKCSDNTADLQRYLRYGDMTFMPGMSEAYDLSELEGIDINNEEAVAQRMATLSDQDQIKLFFTGMIMSTCDAVKVYIKQLEQWEKQYNFLDVV